MPDSAVSDVVVSTQWVFEHLKDDSVVVVEVNASLEVDYKTGHIPGAVGWGLAIQSDQPSADDTPCRHWPLWQ